VNSSCIISVDIGTSAVKAILCEIGGRPIATERAAYATCYPAPGRVEQDPDAILAALVRAIGRLVAASGRPAGSIAALVFGGIWHSLLPIDADNRPLCRASIWADLRSMAQNETLRASLGSEAVKAATGCALHPMYHLSRLMWLKEEEPAIFRKADRFVSIKEYLLSRLFDTRLVDHSTASGTGLWNLATRDWDPGLLALVGLDKSRFSECVEPTLVLPGLRREFAAAMGLLPGTPGVIGAADGALAHLGAAGLRGDRLSLSVGTSVAMRRWSDAPRLIGGSEAWCYYLAEGSWLLGEVLHDGGNTMTWLADSMFGAGAEPRKFDALSRMAGEVAPGSDGLLFLPYFGGERSPRYRPDTRGTIQGLSFNHGQGHLVRALMEGLAHCMNAIYRDLACGPDLACGTLPELVVTGGILNSPTWLGIVADSLGTVLRRPGMDESAAWGGVLLGARAIGAYSSLAEAAASLTFAEKVEPDRARLQLYRKLNEDYDALYARLYQVKAESHDPS
jgi:gluconokinase